jgi:hypothetical protein|tara:strand:- start:8821 stop:9132 length:312 start_codon:yes stop_codon:yes gene_type:complete
MDIEYLYKEKTKTFVGMSYNEDLNIYLMHMEMEDWKVSTYKRYRKIWDNVIIPEIKKAGIKEFYGLCDNKKAVKFNQMFGLNPTGLMVTTTDGVEQILTKKEL